MLELLRYQREDGGEPFSAWLNTLRDKSSQARIRVACGSSKWAISATRSRWARASSNYAYIPELAIASTAAGTARLSSCCCVAETKAARLATSRSPRRCGRNGNGGRHEQAQGRGISPRRGSRRTASGSPIGRRISQGRPGIAGRPRRPGRGPARPAHRSRSLRWPGRRRGASRHQPRVPLPHAVAQWQSHIEDAAGGAQDPGPAPVGRARKHASA